MPVPKPITPATAPPASTSTSEADGSFDDAVERGAAQQFDIEAGVGIDRSGDHGGRSVDDQVSRLSATGERNQRNAGSKSKFIHLLFLLAAAERETRQRSFAF